MNRTVALRKAWDTIVTESQTVVVMNAAFFASVEKIKYNLLFFLSFISYIELGYYMPARGYEFYLRVFNSISHEGLTKAKRRLHDRKTETF